MLRPHYGPGGRDFRSCTQEPRSRRQGIYQFVFQSPIAQSAAMASEPPYAKGTYHSKEASDGKRASPSYLSYAASKPSRNSASKNRRLITIPERSDPASDWVYNPRHPPVDIAPPPLLNSRQVLPRCPNPSNFRQPQHMSGSIPIVFQSPLNPPTPKRMLEKKPQGLSSRHREPPSHERPPLPPRPPLPIPTTSSIDTVRITNSTASPGFGEIPPREASQLRLPYAPQSRHHPQLKSTPQQFDRIYRHFDQLKGSVHIENPVYIQKSQGKYTKIDRKALVSTIDDIIRFVYRVNVPDWKGVAQLGGSWWDNHRNMRNGLDCKFNPK